jgi:regulator of RNase E activity RraA
MNTSEVVALFKGLRVTDVRDGMDWVGLHTKGTVGREISPLFQGAQAVGVARTIRLRPSQKTVPHMTPDEYTRWAYDYWYGEVVSMRMTETLTKGEMIVIESAGLDVGEVGSNNSLEWYAAGASGIVTSGGLRDRDECIKQKVPIFYGFSAQKMLQGRVELDSTDIPVNIGGTLIRPGDVVIGDGDGVICVPIEKAEIVAKYARQEADNDKIGRRKLYEKLGWSLDDTVR